jgi:NADPH2:quinone reductase
LKKLKSEAASVIDAFDESIGALADLRMGHNSVAYELELLAERCAVLVHAEESAIAAIESTQAALPELLATHSKLAELCSVHDAAAAEDERAASLLAEAGLRSLKEFGRLVVVGFATGTIPSLPANQVLLRNRTVVGVDWGAWAMGHGAENAVVMAEVMALAAEGKIKPVEPSSRPLDEAPAVLRELLERQVVGKVCLVP